jgi:hypothetical protein
MKMLYRLTDRAVKTTLPGKYHDGAGLYLICLRGAHGISRNWSFRYSIGNGKHRYLGLGAYPLVSLADAPGTGGGSNAPLASSASGTERAESETRRRS